MSEAKYGGHLIPFDKNGVELFLGKDKNKAISQRVLDDLSDTDKSFTDVFIMSHGWLNDLPGAQKSYQKWVKAMVDSDEFEQVRQKCREQTGTEFKPLLIGIHWPSKPLGDETLEEDLLSFDTTSTFSVEELVDLYAKQIADTEVTRQALRTIFEAMKAMEEMEADEIPEHLSPEVQQAYKDLAQEIGLSFDGVAGAPGADQESFDPDSIFQAALKEAKEAERERAEGETVSFSFNVLGWFANKVKGIILSPLRVISFWDKKKLACKIGENAVFPLLKKLQNVAGEKVRFHLMGHSFGCIVVSAAIAGPKDDNLSRPINSLTLIQGALSLWSYCPKIPQKHDSKGRSGYFYSIIEKDNKKVIGPIITTQSRHDLALKWAYRAATNVGGLLTEQVHYDTTNEYPTYGAVGTYGIHIDENDNSYVEPIVVNKGNLKDMPPFKSGKIYNLNCDDIVGGHNAFANIEVAYLVWSAVLGGIKAPPIHYSSFDIGQGSSGYSTVIDNAEFSATQAQLIQSLEHFVHSTTLQVEQLKAKVTLAQKFLDELKKQD